jgi:predicted ATPase
MKIREVRAQNLRNFGPDAPAVSFVDPDTHLVRPLTILVGANGSGKTTLLELIELLCLTVWPENMERNGLRMYSDPETRDTHHSLFRTSSSADLKVELSASNALGAPPEVVSIQANIGPGPSSADIVIDFKQRNFSDATSSQHHNRLIKHKFLSGDGGLLYFPSHRWFSGFRGVAVTRPTDDDPWIYRYFPSDQWEGSLSQLWVWQNYLDLEAQQEGHPNLLPFVETIQTILGKDQRLIIHRGEVWIERPHKGDRIRAYELPSGERQVLVIFGEIVRRLKPGSIIMIDEIEISLHPALQRVVLYHLRRLAKLHDLQIILTTHSLEIVTAADPSEIVNLDDMVFTEYAARTAEAAE